MTKQQIIITHLPWVGQVGSGGFAANLRSITWGLSRKEPALELTGWPRGRAAVALGWGGVFGERIRAETGGPPVLRGRNDGRASKAKFFPRSGPTRCLRDGSGSGDGYLRRW